MLINLGFKLEYTLTRTPEISLWLLQCEFAIALGSGVPVGEALKELNVGGFMV
jgi:hypothetical protein